MPTVVGIRLIMLILVGTVSFLRFQKPLRFGKFGKRLKRQDLRNQCNCQVFENMPESPAIL